MSARWPEVEEGEYGEPDEHTTAGQLAGYPQSSLYP